VSCSILETPEADSQEALPCRSWAGLAPPFANRKAVQIVSSCPAHTLVLEIYAGDRAECLSSLTEIERCTAGSGLPECLLSLAAMRATDVRLP